MYISIPKNYHGNAFPQTDVGAPPTGGLSPIASSPTPSPENTRRIANSERAPHISDFPDRPPEHRSHRDNASSGSENNFNCECGNAGCGNPECGCGNSRHEDPIINDLLFGGDRSHNDSHCEGCSSKKSKNPIACLLEGLRGRGDLGLDMEEFLLIGLILLLMGKEGNEDIVMMLALLLLI